jgi:cytochrome c-type biogenesis protein CcmE
MLGKKVKYRIFYLLISLISLASIIFFIFTSLEENVVYFFSPTDIKQKTEISFNDKIRIGGLVKEGSINKKNTTINFIITDLKNEIIVSYNGSIPNLFSEGKGVIAEGKLEDKQFFVADSILAKHDENYMPPEVKKALEN